MIDKKKVKHWLELGWSIKKIMMKLSVEDAVMMRFFKNNCDYFSDMTFYRG